MPQITDQRLKLRENILYLYYACISLFCPEPRSPIEQSEFFLLVDLRRIVCCYHTNIPLIVHCIPSCFTDILVPSLLMAH